MINKGNSVLMHMLSRSTLTKDKISNNAVSFNGEICTHKTVQAGVNTHISNPNTSNKE